MEVKDRFLNFPIVLLQGFLENHKSCLVKIFRYSVFEMVYSDEPRFVSFDSLDEFMEEFEFPISENFIPSIEKHGRELYDSCDGMNYPWTGIHIETLEKFIKDRSEFDLICLLLFMALKSIVQVKPFCNAKDPIILSRMSGFSKTESHIPEKITHWMKCESRRRKVFSELEKHYKVVRAYKARGTTFSINKLTQEELEFAILKQKEKKSDSQSPERKRQAKADAKKKFEEWKKKNGGNEPNKT